MNENEKTKDMVDTTDCLEAVNAFKATKNFLFFVILLCLLLLQAAFWLRQLGYIDNTGCYGMTDKGLVFGVPCSGRAEANPDAGGVVEASTAGQAGTIAEQAQLATADIGEETAQPDESAGTAAPAQTDINQTKPGTQFAFNCSHIATLIWACNFILIIAATLYCFILLVSIKISLVGRLGGMNHICRAFILSLFGLVLLFPWQRLFAGVVAGTVYTPAELLCTAAPTAEDTVVSQVLWYLRFLVLWLVTLLLFVFAQVRSARWAGATLRRLGLIH